MSSQCTFNFRLTLEIGWTACQGKKSALSVSFITPSYIIISKHCSQLQWSSGSANCITNRTSGVNGSNPAFSVSFFLSFLFFFFFSLIVFVPTCISFFYLFFFLSSLRISPLQANCVGRRYLSVPGRPITCSLDNGRARAYCACSRCGRGKFGYFFCGLSFFLSGVDGCLDFTSFSIEFQLYQDDGWVMDDCAQWKSRLQSKRSRPQAVLEFGTTRSAGQRLHHRVTGTPVSGERLDIDWNTVWRSR